MKKLLNRIKEDVLVIDQKGKIRYCNEKLCGKLYYHSKFMDGWDIEEIVEDAQALRQQLIYLVGGEELVLKLKDRAGQILQYVCKVVAKEWENSPAFVLMGKVKEDYQIPSPSMCQVLDQLPCGVLVKSLNGRYTYINQVADEKCGMRKADVLGKTDRQVWGEEIGKVVEQEDEIILKTQEPKHMEVWRNVGEMKLFKVYKLPFYQEKRLAGIIKICRDETLSWLMAHQQNENDEELRSIGESTYRNEVMFNQDFQEMKIEQCLIRELKAQGVCVLAYDDEKNQLTSYFYEGVCRTIIQQDGRGYIPADNLGEIIRDERYHGVHPVEESLFARDAVRICSRGIKDIGIHPIYYNQEFMGVLVIFYEAYDYTLKDEKQIDEKVCKQLAMILKQFELSRKLKEELERRKLVEEELGYLLDTAADVIKVVDKHKCIQMVSQSFCDLVGRSKSEIMGRHYKEFIYTEDNQLQYDVHEKEMIHYTTQSGENIWIEWHVKYNAEKDMYICIGTDITKARELAQQQADYEKQVQKESVRNEFFAKISHEFRTPINMILSSLELIAQMGVEQNMQALLNQMQRRTYGLLELVDNLMDMTEIDTGFAQLQLEVCNIVEVIETVVEVISKRMKTKQIQWVFDTQIEEQQMSCDRIKIQRAIGSVISNAIKRIAYEGRIQVEVQLIRNKVNVSITDTGRCGQEEAFFIAQSFVGMHGGRVFVQSISEGGNTICIELPLRVEGNRI
ncbi:MAG: PAS domain S-box protein [Cellulosilyticaceae bacterium]